MKAVLLVLAFSQVFAYQPNVGGYLDLAWLNKTNAVVVPIVENLIVEYVTIPQFNTTISTPLGNMEIKATNIRASELELDTTTPVSTPMRPISLVTLKSTMPTLPLDMM